MQYWNPAVSWRNKYRDGNPEGSFWWIIYQYEPTNSPNLKSKVSTHHASAYERAECALVDLEQLYNFYLIKKQNEY